MLDKSSRDFSRFMLANAFEIEIDSHNRILIPSTLSAFSNINEGEIILSGVGNRIEI
ncbi:MAG: division/cell wall cluster transcriptional repressor MraZ [Cyanobium sp. MAG06]|nr:division/cell wall cluster transcriptional repressor MraZ [Cyanobium sp. MAG06]